MIPFPFQLSWTNVRLIYLRELRDQSRDRRTLFTIVVLPMILYPLLAMTIFQIQQFRQEHPSAIRLLGAEALPESPPLLTTDEKLGTSFNEQFCLEVESRLLKIETRNPGPVAVQLETLRKQAEKEIQSGAVDAVVYFPPDFIQRLKATPQSAATGSDSASLETSADSPPQPHVFFNQALEKSRVAAERVERVLGNWRRALVLDNLKRSNIPEKTTQPFEVLSTDVAEQGRPQAAIWSKVLPLVLLIWALTGAFYPAIDLCAGEKERGTLETLLCSPALRTEIVWGKLLTVMTFSMATSILNLAGMCLTGTFIMRQIQQMTPNATFDMGPPPLSAVCWLLAALVPISAMFSALSLAIATFARSSKEGQYYLMPLLMISLPLMMLPIMPASELNLGTSLIPLTGVMLLLRSLIEGQYWEALKYFPFVTAVTATCCWLSIRWAVSQFQNESVLFRESERFNLKLWIRQLHRDREDTPRLGEALFCGVLILVIRFFANFMVAMPTSWKDFANTTLVVQIALIATPACLMAIMLTRRPLWALSLRRPSFWSTIPAAALLALLLHPATVWLANSISLLYPLDSRMGEALQHFVLLLKEMPLWAKLLLIGVTPAICEELAFRGFILSGLRRMGNKWGAIVLTSLFFGITHGILQQSLSAFVVGIVIGYLAVKTGSIFPAMAFHCMHNCLGVLLGYVTPDLQVQHSVLRLVFDPVVAVGSEQTLAYSQAYSCVALAGGLAILLWYKKLPYRSSKEEILQESIDQQPLPMYAGNPLVPSK